ncbi:MAG TPA: WecB/TagA/CpsF family glycosyltransferase, partial [Thermomicrobiales bacterium]|nr:WecB/TagA/CpsF family glycosyltransferase [Thermomicrobiales bacterium]
SSHSTTDNETFLWIDVLDVPVDLVTARETRAWLMRQLAAGVSCAHVVTLNPEYVMTARRNRDFAAILREAELSTIDGAGISLAVRLLDRPSTPFERMTGVALTWLLADISAETGDGLFLLGAGPGVATRAGEALQEAHPGTVIAGTWAEGSPRPEDDAETMRRIAESGASVVLVAYGAPSQVFWIARNRDALSAAGVRVVAGVGGALDYISGNVPWAPPLVRKFGLEWAYRLVREPWRWRRQVVLPLYAALVMREAIRMRCRGGDSRRMKSGRGLPRH